MKKLEVYKYLDSKNIKYEITEHKAVFNMEEIAGIEVPYPEADAKNLFIRDRKKNYYLISVKGNKRVDLKAFRNKIDSTALTFASESDLMDILGLTPGSVTPLGVLNDKEHVVKVFIDSELKDGLIGIHPNDNTATIWINTNTLVELIKECGNSIQFIDL